LNNVEGLADEPARSATGPVRLLGLDVGDRRIGIAVSDPTGSLARPVEIYQRRGVRVDVKHILDVAGGLEADPIVVGLPKNMNGTEGPQAAKTREFAVALERDGCSVVLWDERLSTIEAVRRINERGHKRRSGLPRVDSEAAAIILQNYLDHLRYRQSAIDRQTLIDQEAE
jgi:putative holliday junction resolvase